MPRVSIIIPVYNTEKYLQHCLNSLHKQSFTDFEVICVDDCSTDNSIKILEQYCQEDSRFKIIKNSENTGPAQARNIGVKYATGEFLYFPDADDYLKSELLIKMVNIFDNNKDIDIIEFAFNLFEENEYKAQYLDRGKSAILETKKSDIMHCTAAWNKAFRLNFYLKKKFKFTPNVPGGEVPMVICALLSTEKFYYLDYVGYVWRRVEGSFSYKMDDNKLNGIINMTKHLKSELISRNLYNKRFYNLAVLRILNWNLGDNSPEFYKKYALKIYKKLTITSEKFGKHNIVDDLNIYKLILEKMQKIELTDKALPKKEKYFKLFCIFTGSDKINKVTFKFSSRLIWLSLKVNNFFLCLKKNGLVYTVKLLVRRI